MVKALRNDSAAIGDTAGDQPSRDFELQGLTTKGASGKMAALEADGTTYVPTTRYWMTPRQA